MNVHSFSSILKKIINKIAYLSCFFSLYFCILYHRWIDDEGAAITLGIIRHTSDIHYAKCTCVLVCLYVYVFMCVCLYACLCVRCGCACVICPRVTEVGPKGCRCACLRACMHARVCACVHPRVRAFMRVCVCVRACVRLCVYVPACVRSL